MEIFCTVVVDIFICFGLVQQTVTVTDYHQNLSRNSAPLNCSVLYLLNVQAFPDNREFAGWDRGLDLIPAGHLAAEQINNRSDILSGHELEIIDIDSEACGRNILIKGLVNFYKELVVSKNNMCILGVIGSVCSSATNVIARISGHPNITYIEMALSVSPQHRSQTEFPYLFHTISSSSAFNKAAIAIMKAFDWKRVALVHDALGFYFLSTSKDFVRQIKESYSSAEIITRVQLTNSQKIFPGIFKLINDQEIRISYWVVSQDQGAFSLCEAYKRNFLWPGHVYIVRFTDLNNLLQASEKTSCTQGEIELALEGVFLLEYRLFVKNNTKLYSSWSYEEFRQRYRERLYAEERSDRIEENIYANSLYDQVWAFALAINGSLTSINSRNLSFTDYRIGNTKSISEILKDELKKLSFQGASGRIEFNEHQEVPSFVDIFQIQNKSLVLIGIYDPFTKNVTFTEHISAYVPRDSFETIYDLLPSWLGGCMLTAQAILFCTISGNLLLLLCWRSKIEIKATSPILSVLIMVGCYLLCTASTLQIVQRMIEITNITLLSAMCNIEAWFKSIGLDLILATLFLKLLRVHHIFKLSTSIKRYWFDKYIFFYVLLICAGKVCLHGIWTAIDPINPEARKEYVPSSTPPYYKATLHCSSNLFGIWLLFTLVYSGILLLLVLFMAIQTRHVKKDDFKDTKKVNLFIFSTVIILAIGIPLWLIFDAVRVEIGADVSEWLTYFSVTLMCQLCLFAPKTVPLALRNFNIYTESSGTEVKSKSQHITSTFV